MKRVLVILLALALAAILLPGCPGKGGGGGGSEWLNAGVARAVDKQFGPVTVGASEDGPTLAAEGAGSHEANQLGGRVSADTVKMAVQFVMETWLPATAVPLPSTPLPGRSGEKSPLSSKLTALGSGISAGSNPCEQDGDNDGIPDINENLCDPVTDEHCTGLCVDGTAVECKGKAGAFTIKFTDCQINVTTWLNIDAIPYWKWSTFMPTQVATSTVWTTLPAGLHTTAFAQTGLFCSNSTVNGTVAKILDGWNPTLDTVNGVDHSTVSVFTSKFKLPNLCGYWDPDLNSPVPLTGTAFSTEVQCAAGWWRDYSTVVSGAEQIRYYPYSPAMVGITLGSIPNPVQIKVNGSITLAQGFGGVDEQLLHTRYNDLLQVWSTDGLGMESNPYAIYNGQALDYRVLHPNGQPAAGTTWGGKTPPFDSEWFGHQIGMDAMFLESRRVKMDMDGENGTAFAPGDYSYRGGFDNEDLFFLFTEGNNIVSWGDKRGDLVLWKDFPNYDMARGMGGWRLVGVGAAGNPIYALSFFEKDNGEDDKCMIPQNKTPCQISVEIDPKLRTFDVLSIANCQALDAADAAKLTDVSF